MPPGGSRRAPLPLQALALTALALVLLLPTFNALNTAAFDGTPPFEVDPPEDAEPPEDLPEDYEGAGAAGGGSAGASCPTTTEREVWGDRTRFGWRLTSGDPEGRVELDVPPNAIGVGLVVNFSSWHGDMYAGPVDGNGTREMDREQVTRTGSGSMARSEPELFQFESPTPGRWTAEWEAAPVYGSGSVGFVMRLVECKAPEEDAP